MNHYAPVTLVTHTEARLIDALDAAEVDALDAAPTGEECFSCGMPRFEDDDPYVVTLFRGAYVSWCGGCPQS